MKERAYYVMPGAATRGPCEVGVLERIMPHVESAGFGGASFGGIIAMYLALGKSADDAVKLCRELMTRKGLKDLSLWPLKRFGIYKGEVLYRLLTEVFGDKKMSDAILPVRVVVASMGRRRREEVCDDGIFVRRRGADGAVRRVKVNDANVLMRDCARATGSMPAFYRQWQLRKDDPCLYVDGGTVDNNPHDVFDDLTDAPTLGMCFADEDNESPRPVRDGDIEAYAMALFDLRQDAANHGHPSKKPGSQTVIISTKSDGMKFELTQDDVSTRLEDGRRSADRWLAARG